VTTLNMALLMEFLLQNSLLHGKDRFFNSINCGDSRNLQWPVWLLLGFKLVIHHVFDSSLCKCNFFFFFFCFEVSHCVLIFHMLWWICLHKHQVQFIVWEWSTMKCCIVQIELCVVSRNLPGNFFNILSYLHQNTLHQVFQFFGFVSLCRVFVQTIWKYQTLDYMLVVLKLNWFSAQSLLLSE
jgi:hypothetical protein